MRRNGIALLGGIVALTCLLALPAPARVAAAPAGAATPRIATFYPTSQKAYDRWNGSASSAPSGTASFAAGTSKVAFYFTFSGATANATKEHITIYDQHGKAVFAGTDHVLNAASGPHMTAMDNGAAYPTGLYRVDLTMDNGAFASTSFTVGLKNPILEFFPITIAAAQKSQLPNDPVSYRYAAGATGVAVFYHIARSAPKTTKLQLALYQTTYDAASKSWSDQPFFQGRVFTLTDKDAGYEGDRSVISDSALGDNRYHAILLVNGQPMASTAFIIGA